MTDEESLRAAIDQPVELAPYDPAWPAAFAAERRRLLGLFAEAFVSIEHIGSTAIVGMGAKPIIDLLVGVTSLGSVSALEARLRDAGYTTSAEFNASLSDRKWFMRWSNGRRSHHLHVVVHEGSVWRDRLAFRDCLRSSPNAAADYLGLKSRLAARHRDDREAYTDAKAEFIQATLTTRPT